MIDASPIQTILTGLVGVGVIGLFKLSRQVTQLDTAIRGVKGDNGLVGTVQELVTAKDDLTGRMVAVEGDVRHLSSGRRGHA